MKVITRSEGLGYCTNKVSNNMKLGMHACAVEASHT